MAILIDRHARVITQGLTGRAGQFHTAACRDYAHGRGCFVGGVNPRKAGEDCAGLPVFGSVREAKRHTGATVSVIYVPPPFASAAIDEAVDAGIELVVCITQGIPVRDMIRTRHRMQGSPTALLGPSSPGLVTPGELAIGIMPGPIHRPGRIGVLSSSGALTFEAVSQLGAAGLGQSTVVGLGRDPVGGLTHVDVLKMFNDDPDTDAVLMVGEIGSDAEEQCAHWVHEHMRKPVIGFIAGLSAPASRSTHTAHGKLSVLAQCGIRVARHPGDVGTLLARVASPECLGID